MAPKMGPDEDGDIPPCNATWSLKAAQAWDNWKQEQYGGKQKAQPMVEVYKALQAKVDNSKGSAILHPTKGIVFQRKTFIQAQPPPRPWWQRVLCGWAASNTDSKR